MREVLVVASIRGSAPLRALARTVAEAMVTAATATLAMMVVLRLM